MGLCCIYGLNKTRRFSKVTPHSSFISTSSSGRVFLKMSDLNLSNTLTLPVVTPELPDSWLKASLANISNCSLVNSCPDLISRILGPDEARDEIVPVLFAVVDDVLSCSS